MKLSDEQNEVINAPLTPISVTACAGSGKTETAIRRLIAIRQKMGKNRGRVVLLSFSNVAVNTFNKRYTQLALALPDEACRKRVEVATLDSFFTQYVLRPHAYRTMAATQPAYLVQGSESFLNGFQYWPDKGRPLPIKDIKVGIRDGEFFFFSDAYQRIETLDIDKALKIVNRLGQAGAYTHELGRYWVYQALVKQPAVLRALATRYPQILVDESQDLSAIHQATLELLIDAGVQVSLIGDVNQGIYGFAGADGSFLRTYEDRAGVIGYKLTCNYRSLPSIVNIANSLCDRDNKSDRQQKNGGAYFIGYKDSDLPMLFELFKAKIDELGIPYQDAVILSRGASQVEKIVGNNTASLGRGLIAIFAKASLLRDQQGLYQECYKLVCKAVVELFASPPKGLSSDLQGAPHEKWILGLRRLLWGFCRNKKTGLPSSELVAKTEWHSQLKNNIEVLLAIIKQQYGLFPIGTVGNKLAKTGLINEPLSTKEVPQDAPGIRVETVHQVKGESIGAVLFVAKKANIKALLSGTDGEEGRIGYVAITRAKNLFLLAVPDSNLVEFRKDLLATGFIEASIL